METQGSLDVTDSPLMFAEVGGPTIASGLGPMTIASGLGPGKQTTKICTMHWEILPKVRWLLHNMTQPPKNLVGGRPSDSLWFLKAGTWVCFDKPHAVTTKLEVV